MSVKLRQVGTSKVLTVPSQIRTDATEYSVFVSSDGAIVYIPQQETDANTQKIAEKHGVLSSYQF